MEIVGSLQNVVRARAIERGHFRDLGHAEGERARFIENHGVDVVELLQMRFAGNVADTHES